MTEGTIFATRTWLVGGVVRDLQLGYDDFEDFDLCIEQPLGGLLLAKYLQNRGIPQSIEIFEIFSTARISLEGIRVDLVTSRTEIYRNHRRYPKIRYAPIQEDVWRRDFTINALYMNISDRKLLDPCKMGLDDLAAKRIRTLREPMLVFREDSLRILRALRFAASLRFDLAEDTAKAIEKTAHYTKRLSKAAWRFELQKLKQKDIWDEVQKLYSQYGIANYIPEDIIIKDFPTT